MHLHTSTILPRAVLSLTLTVHPVHFPGMALEGSMAAKIRGLDDNISLLTNINCSLKL